MRLVLVELSRFRSRRAIALMLLAAVLLAALMAFTTLWDTRPVSPADLARAEAQAERDMSARGFQRELASCEAHPRRYMGPGASSADCREMMMPRPEWYLDRGVLRLAEVRHGVGAGLLLLLAGIMVIVGTTFAGADWSSGSMSNQLLFEPRRPKVWLAKAAAVLVGTLVATAVIMTAFWATMFVAADARGIATGATVQEDIRAMVGRGVLLAAAGAVGAFALTMLLRHTVGTLATLFAYAVGGTAVIAALPFTGVGRWSVGNNVLAWLNDGYRYYDSSLPCGQRGMCDQMATVTLAQGATYLGVMLALVVVASVLLFRRRDIP
jgi:ABC-2 type transport system permease protein